MLEIGDLVLFTHKGNTPEDFIGLVMGDYEHECEDEVKSIYWGSKGRVSPVNVAYLERLNEK